MQTLDKGANAKALHIQIVNYFRRQILEGHYSPGSKLPPEIHIAAQQQISRGTVRQALNTLVNEGFLERVPGKGTFVLDISSSKKAESRALDKRIGLLLNQPTLQLSLEILLGAEQAAKSRGYEVSLTYSREYEQQRSDIIRFQNNQVSGIILFPVSNAKDYLAIKDLIINGLPVVMVDRYLPEIETDYVVADNRGGGYRATEHLIILGNTRIGFAYSNSDSFDTTSVRDRWQGYRQALQEYGLRYDEALVFSDLPVPFPGPPNLYDELVQNHARPAAIFAVNDSVALGLLQAAQRNGVRVPEDLALVGFDDLSFAPYLTPALTTVAQPRMEIGVRAANLLINRIEGQLGPYQNIELPTNLIVRASCGVRLHLKRAQQSS